MRPVIKNFPTKKNPESSEFYQTFKKELMPIVLKLSHKFEEEGTCLNLFYEASIITIPKPDKDTLRKQNYRQIISNEHRCKYP